MKKISVKALRRILSDDYLHRPDDAMAEAKEKEFRQMYLVLGDMRFKEEWNDRAKTLKREYADFLTSLDAVVSKEDSSSTCTLGRIKFKVNEVYVYGFPREFRRLIKDKQIRRIQSFEKVSYEIDVIEVGKTAKICLTLSEGYATHQRKGMYHTKVTVMKIESTQDVKLIPMRRDITPPQHIPKKQEYLWVMKHLSEEDNFRSCVSSVLKRSTSCCGVKLSSYPDKIYFCSKCGSNIYEKFGGIEFSNFLVTNLDLKSYFSEEVLKLEDAPYNYVTTKRTRRSNTPVF